MESQETLSRDEEIREGERASGAVLFLAIAADGMVQTVLLGRSPVTVGRGRGAHVVVQDRSLSRLHARFSRSDDEVLVVDLGSRNGTVINGEAVPRGTMRPGDVAVLGNVVIEVQSVDSPRTALLGLSSLSGLRREIDEEFTRAKLFRRPLALAFIRSNAPIQEKTLTDGWATRLRACDRAGLYDARSLILLMPETDAVGAAELTRGLLEAAGDDAQLVAGVAAYPESAFTPDQLMTSAIAAAVGATAAGVTLAPGSWLVRAPETTTLIYRNPAMLEVLDVVQRVAQQTTPVLIVGETGTGKELIAREIHSRSPRRERPLKIINCAALPLATLEAALFGHVKGAFPGAERAHAGAFERARGGTILLDELGELTPSAQAALLRVIDTGRVCPVGGDQEIEVDVRLLSSTHRDLSELIGQGNFRLDLFHRLNVFTLAVPPLRDRPEEIPLLVQEFVRKFRPAEGSIPQVSLEAMATLQTYAWPGNVRELRNVIERALTLASGGNITGAELPKHIAHAGQRDGRGASARFGTSDPAEASIDLRNELAHHEARLIRSALEKTNGNQRRAAELLKLPLRTLERRLRELGLNRQG